jgi:hypothetical protein
VILFLAACRDTVETSFIEPNATPLYSIQDYSNASTEQKGAENNGNTHIEDNHLITGIYRVKYDLVDIDIEFPQLDGLHDNKLENMINELIYSSVITNSEINWGGTRYKVKIKYEITCFNEKYISIVFSGDKDGVRYNSYRNAVTIDLATGKEVWLSEFFSIDEIHSILYELMLTEKCSIKGDLWVDNSEAKEFIMELCIDQFTETKDNSWKHKYYLRDSKLGFIIYVADPEYFSVEFDISEIPWK